MTGLARDKGLFVPEAVPFLGMEKIGPILPGPAKTGSAKCGRTAMLSNPIFGIRIVFAHPLEQATIPSRASVMTALCRTASSGVCGSWSEFAQKVLVVDKKVPLKAAFLALSHDRGH